MTIKRTSATRGLLEWQLEHEKSDQELKDTLILITETLKKQPTREDLAAITATIPTKEQMELLATKKDIAELQKVWSNVKLAATIISGGGRFTLKTVLVLASLFAAVAVVSGAFKLFFAGVIAWFINPFR